TAAARAVPVNGMKTVRYQGYTISVPASWPVYDLNASPHQCVRYDVNAVYLGTPGADQDCPAGLVGRADTISIGGPAAPPDVSPPRSGARDLAPPDAPHALGAQLAPRGIFQDAQQHEFALAMPDTAPAITATYGDTPDLVEHLLSSVQPARTSPQPGKTPA